MIIFKVFNETISLHIEINEFKLKHPVDARSKQVNG